MITTGRKEKKKRICFVSLSLSLLQSDKLLQADFHLSWSENNSWVEGRKWNVNLMVNSAKWWARARSTVNTGCSLGLWRFISAVSLLWSLQNGECCCVWGPNWRCSLSRDESRKEKTQSGTVKNSWAERKRGWVNPWMHTYTHTHTHTRNESSLENH